MGLRIDKSIPAEGWIERNIDTLISKVSKDARQQKPLPLGISFHGIALQKFIQILKSKNAFFPNPDGSFSFLGIPIRVNNRLPYGCFVVERFREVKSL